MRMPNHVINMPIHLFMVIMHQYSVPVTSMITAGKR